MNWLVVGLGNPGPTYAGHRHNVGHMVADELARRATASFSAPKGMRAEVADLRIGAGGAGAVGADTAKVAVMKPRTYMNESGGPVAKVAAFYRTTPDHLIVIHDELDLDFGAVRLKSGGGDNGHNGLKSIRAALGTGDYFRVRFGIGRPPGRMSPADWVLSNFPARDRTDLEVEIGRAADAVETLVHDGLILAQNRFH
ncbi:aminoacyl-tRNA hydrolase [Granulicoccus phenolivorans]|uniref:aminoacyl-tRNA hydrolase n=1 Tax=Granulicoccus phenolivorans TaxID=266854 RepID=UPI00041CA176|nr:aminoacyl-tRNA hydrolase [Granulicoccus phenolivorans]